MKCIRQFIKWIRKEGIIIPTYKIRKDILAYKEYLRNRLKLSTVQTYIISLKQFYNWTETEYKI